MGCSTRKLYILSTFNELGLSEHAIASVLAIGFTEPTEIQQKAIGLVLAGRDMMASAQTGTGKTAAYALPILEHIPREKRRPVSSLVLVPTRELAIQVREAFEMLGKGHSRQKAIALYGGTGYGMQIKAIHRGADIVVATPGRLLDLVDRRLIDLSHVNVLVLDEADRMLDMGFMPQVRKVVSFLKTQRQTLMFSATIDSRIEKIAGEFLINPVTVRVASTAVEPASIEQHVHRIDEFGKDKLLLQLIQSSEGGSVLVFTKTRRKATWICQRLREQQVQAEEIHSDISQNQRERTLKAYRQGTFNVLVATDIAARGIDVPAISQVINYDLPMSASDYVHRIGRTGRAGRSGVAHSFVSDDQRYLIRDIERVIGRKFDGIGGDDRYSGPRGGGGGGRRPGGSVSRFKSRRRVV